MRPSPRLLRLAILTASLVVAASVTVQAQTAETSFSAADAGTVTYRVVDGQLELLAATPEVGWTVKVERAAGFELDLDFLRDTARVQVDVEFEDGGVRERVRVRDDADDDHDDDRDDDDHGHDGHVNVAPSTSAPAPSDDGTTGSSAPAAVEVTIPDDLFSPPAVTVRAGGTVTWRNQDGSHTVTADDGVFDSGVFDEGERFSHTFTQPGMVSYLCRLHPGMTGTVTVVGAGADAAPADPSTSRDAAPSPAPQASSPSESGDDEAANTDEDGPLVRAADLQFDPDPVRIQAGESVTWEVADDLPHTVTGDAFDSGILEPGATYTATFDEAGTFAYRCVVHPEMKGEVVVAAADPASSTDDGSGEVDSAKAPVAAPAAARGDASSGLPFAATVLFAGMIAAFVVGRVTSHS